MSLFQLAKEKVDTYVETNYAFDLIDLAEKEGISVNDLSRVAAKLEKKIDREKLVTMITAFNSNNNKLMNRADFLKIRQSA